MPLYEVPVALAAPLDTCVAKCGWLSDNRAGRSLGRIVRFVSIGGT